MRTIIVLWMIACLAGCSYFVSMDELARNIQAQMQQEFNSNQDYQRYRFTVQRVKIVQRQGNQFNAISHLNYQGEAYPVNVKIFKVDGGYRWAIEEDAFAFIDEIEIEQYRQQLDRELQQLAAALDDLEPVDESKEHERGSLVTPIAEPEFQGVSYQEEPVPVGNITAYTQ
ncbi:MULTISPECIES: hypothetical protein [Acinetobacter]|uniref:hypothetical protein n=1 Tax=Acinetobacter TaxID=469 RepID=UPI000C250C3C|nr:MULTISPECIES: hypothetical protein [Acinetobacter]PJI33746.1 hypothetical protein CU318_13220 [Acinetobacter pseudolwoffii]